MLAALLLSSKVLAAVQWCAHDAVTHQSQSNRMEMAHAHHAVAPDEQEDCCDPDSAPQTGDPDDCCALWTVEHRSVPKHCICGGAFASVSIGSDWSPPVFDKPASPLWPPAIYIARPSLNVLFKNFRI